MRWHPHPDPIKEEGEQSARFFSLPPCGGGSGWGHAASSADVIGTPVFERELRMSEVQVVVRGSIEDDLAAFLDAWHRAERGEHVKDRVLAFESREALATAIAAGIEAGLSER
jgi:hypothetical protein